MFTLTTNVHFKKKKSVLNKYVSYEATFSSLGIFAASPGGWVRIFFLSFQNMVTKL